MNLRVLVACEFSGVVRDAFRRLGHDAWSCDLLPCEADSTYHIQDNVRHVVCQPQWADMDLLIAHPPCTYLCNSGARWWKNRKSEQTKALAFVRWLLELPVPHIALENPPGKIGTALQQASQYIQPWQFGHGETKTTGLWLKNLPLLQPTNIVAGRQPRTHWESPSPDRWKERSRTFVGIAAAMAEQWGRYALAWKLLRQSLGGP